MNSTFKKALCLSLILSLSAPISAVWWEARISAEQWDTAKSWLPAFTTRNVNMIVVPLLTLGLLQQCWKIYKQYQPKTIKKIVIGQRTLYTRELLTGNHETLTCTTQRDANMIRLNDTNGSIILTAYIVAERLLIVRPSVTEFVDHTRGASLLDQDDLYNYLYQELQAQQA